MFCSPQTGPSEHLEVGMGAPKERVQISSKDAGLLLRIRMGGGEKGGGGRDLFYF